MDRSDRCFNDIEDWCSDNLSLSLDDILGNLSEDAFLLDTAVPDQLLHECGPHSADQARVLQHYELVVKPEIPTSPSSISSCDSSHLMMSPADSLGSSSAPALCSPVGGHLVLDTDFPSPGVDMSCLPLDPATESPSLSATNFSSMSTQTFLPVCSSSSSPSTSLSSPCAPRAAQTGMSCMNTILPAHNQQPAIFNSAATTTVILSGTGASTPTVSMTTTAPANNVQSTGAATTLLYTPIAGQLLAPGSAVTLPATFLSGGAASGGVPTLLLSTATSGGAASGGVRLVAAPVATTIQQKQQRRVSSCTRIGAVRQLRSGGSVVTNVSPHHRPSSCSSNITTATAAGDSQDATEELVPKSSHNIVERRYRSSINDRIQEMRALVCGDVTSDAKMTKSLVLRKAIEYIRFLQHQNQRLRSQLLLCRQQLAACGGGAPVSSPQSSGDVTTTTTPLPSGVRQDNTCWTTPPRSNSTAASSPSVSVEDGELKALDDVCFDDNALSMQQVQPNYTNDEEYERQAFRFGVSSPVGLSDRSRVTLCIFLLAFVTFNPLQQLADAGRQHWAGPAAASSSGSAGGRTMLSLEEDGWSMRWLDLAFSRLAVYSLNCLVLLCCLLNIFIYGEPKVPPDSRAGRQFRQLKQNGDRHYNAGRVCRACDCYVSSLRAVRRGVPSSSVSWCVALAWQTLRQASHCVPGGLWLARRGHRIFMSRKERQDLYTMTADYAHVYHQLHQISLSACDNNSNNAVTNIDNNNTASDDDVSTSAGSSSSNSRAAAAAVASCGLSVGRRCGVTLCLTAVNYADVAGTQLHSLICAEIYATAVLQLKRVPLALTLGGWLLRRLLDAALGCFSAASPHADGRRRTAALRWLTTSAGRRFLLQHEWRYNHSNSPLSADAPLAHPLLYVRQLFHEHLLEKTLYALTMPGGRLVDVCQSACSGGAASGGGEWPRRCHVSDALRYCDLVLQTSEINCCYDQTQHATHECMSCRDSVVRWWAQAGQLVAHWLSAPPPPPQHDHGSSSSSDSAEDAATQRLYARVRRLPERLLSRHWSQLDPLPRATAAALLAYRCQRLGGCSDAVLTACSLAVTSLEHSVSHANCRPTSTEAVQLCQLLVCDLLLQTLTQLWECNSSSHTPQHSHISSLVAPSSGVSEQHRRQFGRVLACLRVVSVRTPASVSRIFLHQATARLMAGAAPQRTHQLLQRSLRHRRPRSYSSVICGKDTLPHQFVGEREHALALLTACKHLPEQLVATCSGERAALLAEAASTLERIGDRRYLNDCFSIIKSIGATLPLSVD